MRALGIVAVACLVSSLALAVGKGPGVDTKPEENMVLMAPTKPTLLFEQDETSLTSTIQIVVTSGAIQDPAGKGGVASLLSELMLRGTKSRSRAKFQSELERMGATLGASASHDNITFTGKVIKENTLRFLNLIEEALTKPAFSAKEFKDLKTETLAEISHLKNSNNRLTGLALRRLALGGTPLERPTTGSLSTVAAIQLKDLEVAYKQAFRRGNLVFAAVSPIPQKEIETAFTAIGKQFPEGMTARAPSIALKVPETPSLVVIHKPETSTGVVMVAQPGITARDTDRYTLATGNFSFGSEPLVSRLFRIIRGELGWTYYIGSTYNATGVLSNQQGFFVVSSTPSVEFTTRTITKTISMWREYLQTGLKKDELALAHDSLVNSYPFEFENAEKRLWQKLYSYLYDVPVLSPEEYEKTIRAVSNDGLKKALAGKHTGSHMWVFVVADKTILEKQLAEEQKDAPVGERLAISKVLTPDELVQ